VHNTVVRVTLKVNGNRQILGMYGISTPYNHYQQPNETMNIINNRFKRRTFTTHRTVYWWRGSRRCKTATQRFP